MCVNGGKGLEMVEEMRRLNGPICTGLHNTCKSTAHVRVRKLLSVWLQTNAKHINLVPCFETDAWSQSLLEGNCTFESVCTFLPAFCTQLSCTIHKSSQLTSYSTEHPMKTISISIEGTAYHDRGRIP